MLTIEIPDDPTTIIYEKPRPREDGRYGLVSGEFELHGVRHFIPAGAGGCGWEDDTVEGEPVKRKKTDCKNRICPAHRRVDDNGVRISGEKEGAFFFVEAFHKQFQSKHPQTRVR